MANFSSVIATTSREPIRENMSSRTVAAGQIHSFTHDTNDGETLVVFAN